jgi:hypothetical protein
MLRISQSRGGIVAIQISDPNLLGVVHTAIYVVYTVAGLAYGLREAKDSALEAARALLWPRARRGR